MCVTQNEAKFVMFIGFGKFQSTKIAMTLFRSLEKNTQKFNFEKTMLRYKQSVK